MKKEGKKIKISEIFKTNEKYANTVISLSIYNKNDSNIKSFIDHDPENITIKEKFAIERIYNILINEKGIDEWIFEHDKQFYEWFIVK